MNGDLMPPERAALYSAIALRRNVAAECLSDPLGDDVLGGAQYGGA